MPPQILDPAVDVTSDIVGIVLLHLVRGAGVARQDKVSETRGVPLHLGFDLIGHV